MKSIVLLQTDKNAEAFFENVFPHHTNLIVATADGTYPREASLANRVREVIQKDPEISLAVIGADSLRILPPATKKILILDEILGMEMSPHQELRMRYGLGLDGARLAFLLRCFFGQGKLQKFSYNAGEAVATLSDYKPEASELSASLLSRPAGSISQLERG